MQNRTVLSIAQGRPQLDVEIAAAGSERKGPFMKGGYAGYELPPEMNPKTTESFLTIISDGNEGSHRYTRIISQKNKKVLDSAPKIP